MVDQIFEVAIRSLSFGERKTFKSAALACGNIIDDCLDKVPARAQAAQQRLLTHGSSLLDAAFRGAGGSVERSNLGTLVEYTICKVNRVAPQQCQAWCQTLLAQPGYPTAKVTNEAKQLFYTLLPRFTTHNTKIAKEAFNNFANACRGLA